MGNICSTDYASSLKVIGQGIGNLKRVYELGCEPQDPDRDGIIDFEVSGGASVPDFTISGKKVTFDTALKNGNYQFHYFCLNIVSP